MLKIMCSLYTFAFIFALQGIGIDAQVLLAGSAALFVGIGFGLQSILGDVFSGIILLTIGITGLYIARIFEEVRGRDAYVIKNIKKSNDTV